MPSQGAVGAVVAVVEQAEVPSPAELVEELEQGHLEGGDVGVDVGSLHAASVTLC
jgi:hypothetical protein